MYCESDFIKQLGHGIKYTLVDLNLCTVEMRQLDEKHGDSYRLILSDNPSLLSRGIDFRAYANGLTLLQAKSAPTKRLLT